MGSDVIQLVSRDRDLIRAVRQVIDESMQPELQLVVHDEVQRLMGTSGTPLLIVVHLEAKTNEASVENCLRQFSDVPKIVVTEELDLRKAVQWRELGVFEFAVRPLDLQRLAFLLCWLHSRNQACPPEASIDGLPSSWDWYSSGSDAMSDVVARVKRLARTDATISIAGETGVGKSLLAKLIHEMSPRRRHEFQVVNCAALPPTLIESELFGHRRGAFTGADSDHIGKFEQAGEGTLLLDEVDTLPLASQAKLLRAVEDRVFERVGCNRRAAFSARLIVASNQQLPALVAAGRFRADLYYRLAVLELHVPPLRERRDEIPRLVGHFLKEAVVKQGRTVPAVSDESMRALRDYGWPGNIRELKNAVEHGLAMCEGAEIHASHLPARFGSGGLNETADAAVQEDSKPVDDAVNGPGMDASGNGRRWLAEARDRGEKKLILDALSRHGNNRTRAAESLGISRAAFYKKLKKFALSDVND